MEIKHRNVPPDDEIISWLGTLTSRESNYHHMQNIYPHKMPHETELGRNSSEKATF